jgi:hypothetical protein
MTFMAAADQVVELVTTRNIDMFIPILREIDFGDQFLLSMLHWCGIGQRGTPLEYWQVFLIRSKQEIVGVSGLYRQTGTPIYLCWLGWFAIRPSVPPTRLRQRRYPFSGKPRANDKLQRDLGLHQRR